MKGYSIFLQHDHKFREMISVTNKSIFQFHFSELDLILLVLLDFDLEKFVLQHIYENIKLSYQKLNTEWVTNLGVALSKKEA